MEWIDVNERLPEPVTNREWFDKEPYIKHCNNLVLAVIREHINKNKPLSESMCISVRAVMYLYNDWDRSKKCVWRGVEHYEEVLFWSEIPNIPDVDYANAKGVVGEDYF